MSATRRSIGTKLGVALLSVVALLVLAELGAQLWLARFASPAQFIRFASLRQVLARDTAPVAFARHPYLGYYPQPGFEAEDNRHDALGYRGADFPRAKPEGEFRIVCLGGSTTYGSGVKSWRSTYPAQLEAELARRGHAGVRVVNAGCNGWSTHETLVNLYLRVLDLDPDLLLMMESANDVHARLVWPPEHYLGDNTGFRAATSGLVMPSLPEHSALWRIVAVTKGWMIPHAMIERTLSKHSEWSVASDFRKQISTGVYPKNLFKTVPAAEVLATNPPTYYRRNLTEMARTARGRGIELVFTSFVYFPADPLSLSGTPEYQRAYAEHEAVQQEVAREQGARYFDLRAIFPAEKRYFTDDMHRNEDGSLLEAGLFADYLEAERLLPR